MCFHRTYSRAFWDGVGSNNVLIESLAVLSVEKSWSQYCEGT
jgi:hypothetical protein